MDPSQTRKANKTSRTSRSSKADRVHSGVRAVANDSTRQGSMAETAATAVGVLKTREGHSDPEWQRIVDAIDDPIGVVTTDYHLVYANAAYLALLEAGGEQSVHHFCFQAIRSPSHDGLRERDGPCADCPLPQTVRTKPAGFVQQEWLSSLASTEQSAVASGASSLNRLVYQRWTYPVLARDGTVEYIVEVVKDVTEQEQMRLAAAHAEAFHQADQLKAELLGTVSHELRNPLAVIKGYTASRRRHDEDGVGGGQGHVPGRRGDLAGILARGRRRQVLPDTRRQHGFGQRAARSHGHHHVPVEPPGQPAASSSRRTTRPSTRARRLVQTPELV
jgi:PAS domain-containing protein